MNQHLRVLIVEDDQLDVELLLRELRRGGYETNFQRVETAESMNEALSNGEWDLVISDYSMPHFSGLAALELVRNVAPGLPFIIVSGLISEEAAVAAMRAGAQDFMSKGKLSRLLPAIEREIAAAKERKTHRAVELAWLEAEGRAALMTALERSYGDLERANEKLRETQAQLVQSAKMASLGELVAGIAHEINNPLAYVIANQSTIDRLLREVVETETLPESPTQKLIKARGRLESMLTGLNRIKDIVLNLRTFSRIDEGELKRIDVGESINSVIMLLEPRIRGQVTIATEYSSDNYLFCSPAVLNQVVMNIIANSLDSIVGVGSVAIRTGKSGGMFSITIADTGAGIPSNIRDRIFEPFFTTKPVGQGTGLGLAISYSIVKAHHGEINVESEMGKGTVFTVKIPLDLETRGVQ